LKRRIEEEEIEDTQFEIIEKEPAINCGERQAER